MKSCFKLFAVVAALAVALLAGTPQAMARPLLIVSTTSVQNSGLMPYLLPKFEKEAGFKTALAAYGTGQALRAWRATATPIF